MKLVQDLEPMALQDAAERVFRIGARKAAARERAWDPRSGPPVITIAGRYAPRGWTEWTLGFHYGIQLLAGEGAGVPSLVNRARRQLLCRMQRHLTHSGVHDHGFNTLSSYGTLLRILTEGAPADTACGDIALCRQAICVSGAVQAARWTPLRDGFGFIYSFNGPHSLFIDTLRTLRVLVAAHRLGHELLGENDAHINLLERAVVHALTTDQYLLFHGTSTHAYDVCGRTAHEGLFNGATGLFRARSTQQGYSPFSTWARGLAWAMLGFSEQVEVLRTIPASDFPTVLGLTRAQVLERLERAATETCDHYIADVAAADGIPYWDDGAPGLCHLGNWRERPADPFNDHEPVDASAAAIAAQGLLRLGRALGARRGHRYLQAGLTVARALMRAPYLSEQPSHQGLLLHSVYHRPNNWDYVPPGRRVPCGESSLWGDYHLLELALLLRRLAAPAPYPTFLSGVTPIAEA